MQLSSPQDIYLNHLRTKYRAYVGGYGSGKTFVGCIDLINFAIKNPKTRQGYFAPTYRDIRDIFFPTIEEAAELYGLRCQTNTANKEVHLFKGRWYYGTVICRSMANPETIVGFKIVRALVDEIDIMPKDKAAIAWRKILGRLRLKLDGVLNDVGVTTTPEGFAFVYDRFKEDPLPSYSMVQASTYENEDFLPDDYISSLLESYPSELVNAYLLGEFVNMRSGTVYYSFNRKLNDTDVIEEPKEPLRIGIDFNVEHMAACVYVVRKGIWYQVREYHHVYDTPQMIHKIKQDFGEHPITCYPDSSGGSRKSADASTSDIKLIKQAGFQVRVKPSNPFVRERILAANQAYAKQTVMVNVKMCPETTRCLEQLAYAKNGEPDKKNNLDHQPDAATYPIAYEMPVVKPMSRIQTKFSH